MRKLLLVSICLAATCGVAGMAQANPSGIDVPSPGLPVTALGTFYQEQPPTTPLCFQPAGPQLCITYGIHWLYPPPHPPFPPFPPLPPPIIAFSGGNEVESFGSYFTGDVSVNGTPVGEAVLSGLVDVTVFGRTSDSETGSFATEITFDLTGSLGGNSIEVITNPNPADASDGDTTISANGNGTYHITSYFDIFTELSLNGGPIEEPVGGGSVHVDLEAPEPASLSLLAAALAGLGLVRRRRHRGA